MEIFDNFMKTLGKSLWKVICLILQIIIYVFIWKIAYWAFNEFSRCPYGFGFFEYNRYTDVADRIPPDIFISVKELFPYGYTATEYFCFFLACLFVVLIFASIHMPRIIGKMNKKEREFSETIPFLLIIIESVLIPVLYYLNINKEFSWWIVKDFILVVIALAVFNFPNFIMCMTKDYGWVFFLIVNLVIAVSFGIMSVFFLYSLFEVLVVIFIILAFFNFGPFFS